jgi:hypothetical protein
MSTSGYEIRHALLTQAREMLSEQWHAAMEVERTSAERENRNPALIEPPSVEQIKATAESLYEFVQKK